MTRRDELLEQLKRFPETPGVYLMKNRVGNLLYIGKAVNIKSRVRSYFSSSIEERPLIPLMMENLHAIDWIATATEAEALILEANLIRMHKPPYNIDLRDDKHYPYLKITVNEPFPRLMVVRRVVADGARYFGPYTDARAMRRLVRYAKRIFGIRDCNRNLPMSKPCRPCINYAMKRCSGACAGLISEQDYRRGIEQLIHFLSGKRSLLLEELEQQMLQESAQLHFEQAALLRDQIALVRDASRMQRVDLKLTDEECDVFGVHQADRVTCMTVLNFREGLLLGTRHFVLERRIWENATYDRDLLILRFYEQALHQEPPAQLLLSADAGFDTELLQQWLDSQNGKRSHILIPQRGTKRALVEMAEKNARLYLEEKCPIDPQADVQDLQAALQLPRLPQSIEAFDISNLGESFAVAGMVRFENGKPARGQYRRYKIKTVSGQNDFAMMMEVVRRRLSRLQQEGKPFADLLLIDGGRGQLNSANAVVEEFANPPMIASLAKQEELLFTPFLAEPVALDQNHPARKLVERVRNEVHRWAITYHRTVRGKQFKRSALEELPGVGPTLAKTLLKAFGSLKGVKAASVEQLQQTKGISLSRALTLFQALHGEQEHKE